MKLFLYCFVLNLLKTKNQINLINNNDILINEKDYFINNTKTKHDNLLKFQNLYLKKHILSILEDKKESNINKLNLINYYNDILYDKNITNFYKDLEF